MRARLVKGGEGVSVQTRRAWVQNAGADECDTHIMRGVMRGANCESDVRACVQAGGRTVVRKVVVNVVIGWTFLEHPERIF